MSLLPTKYILGRSDFFLISRQPKKQTLNIDFNDKVEELSRKSLIHINPIADSLKYLTKAKKLFYI